MTIPRWRTLLFLLALLPARPLWGAVALPFIVDDPDGYWKTAVLEKETAPDVIIEAVLVRAGQKARFIVLRSPKTADGPEALNAAVGKIKGALMTGNGTVRATAETEEFGYRGHEEKFSLTYEQDSMACDLFVFAREQTWWGVLYMASKDLPAPAQSPFAILHQKAATAAGVVEMEPFRAQDNPVTDFPIGLTVKPDLTTGRVAKIIVNDVPPGSSTDRAGVKIDDEIVRINGRKTQDFTAGLSKNSEIGKIFLNRDHGAEVELQLLSPGDKVPHTVTLRTFDPGNASNMPFRLR